MSQSRFGHHPDPAVDFEVEVDAIEGELYEAANAVIGARGALGARIVNALDYTPGGSSRAVLAKAKLQELADQFRKLVP